MKAKINMTSQDIRSALESYWRDRGWQITDFERIEIFNSNNAVVWTKDSVSQLCLYAEVEQEEIN